MKRSIWKTLALLSLMCVGCFAYGFLIEPKLLRIRQVEFVSAKYAGPPIRIGLITDIHVGGLHVPPERVAKLAKEMNVLKPDFVLLPGDFVNGHESYAERPEGFHTLFAKGIDGLKDIDAPTYATLGNHDAWYGAGQVKGLLTKANIIILDNQSETVGDLCLVGLADYETGQPNKGAFANCPDGKTPFIFTHSPQAWQSFRSDTVLALAGHTHGGQINLPILGRRVNATNLRAEHSYGFSKIGGVDVFVSAGVGTSILPARFRSPPEIVVITLRAEP